MSKQPEIKLDTNLVRSAKKVSLLTHYSPALLFYTPKGFLMFSRGIDKQHGALMGKLQMNAQQKNYTFGMQRNILSRDLKVSRLTV